MLRGLLPRALRIVVPLLLQLGPPGLAGRESLSTTCKPSGLELLIGYSESIMMLKISRSVSLMPSRAMRLTLRMVSSTPMVTIPSPA